MTAARRRARLVATSALAGGLAWATVAGAHPHVPGDPFADVGDTIVAGSARLAPLRSASHQRWIVTDVRGGERRPAGTIEQRVTRADTPAGRQWCVAIVTRDATGNVTDRDSIWVSAGSPIPVSEWRAAGVDTFELRFDGREVDGTSIHEGDRSPVGGKMTAALFPRALDRVLLGQLRIAPGEAIALATFALDREVAEKDGREAVQSAGRTLLDHRGRARSCVMLAVTPGGKDALPRTVWIDVATHAVLREEIRDAAGNRLEVLEAE